MSYYTDQLGEHLGDVDTVTTAVGYTMGKPYRDLRARWENRHDGENIADQYVGALVTGAKTDLPLPLLRDLAIAMAATLPTHTATIDNYARAVVHRKLLELAAPEVPKLYAAAGQHFNEAVTKFLGCTAIVDVNQPAENLINADDTARAAWLNAQIATAAVDGAVGVLAAAARLSGYPAATDTELLPLIVSTAGVHRRALWSAWESESRCGRWPALAAITEIKAADDPGAVEPYRRPLPLEEKWVQNPNGHGHVRTVIDPEDAELAEQTG